MPRSARILIALAVALLAAGAGFRLAGALAPEHLHQRVVQWLEKSTKAEAELETLRVVFGFPIRLEGTGLRLYDGALEVESASARFDVVSLLLGRPRLTRLRLDGAHLQAERSPEGIWTPPIFREKDPEGEETALAPLRAIEGTARFLLTRPVLADTLVLRRSKVSVVHADPSGARRPVRVVFESVNGRLLHSRLFGDARLFLRVRLQQEGELKGRLEWTGSRSKEGEMQVTMAATGLDLSSLSTYLRGARPSASLRGTLDGVADFSTAREGHGRLDLDLAARDFETAVAAGDDRPAEPIHLPRLSLRMRVDLDDEKVVLSKARIGTGEFDFALDATVSRPLGERSRASVAVSLNELAMNPETAERLAGWLGASGRDRFVSLARRVRSGSLVHAELRGAARVQRWSELVAGRLERLPAGLRFTLQIADLTIDVDEANRLETLNASLTYQNDKLELRDGSGDLNGGPLPEVDLTLEGLSKLLEAPPQKREMASSAEALVGLTPLFDFLRDGRDDDPAASDPPSVRIHFDHVHHPALLWPIDDVNLQLVLEREVDGVRMQIERAAWAGVRLDGSVNWTLRPDRHLAIDLVASEGALEEPGPKVAEPPVAAPAPSGEPTPWVSGSFEVGSVESPRWAQRGAQGRFSASGGELRLDDVTIELEPEGTLAGSAELDLGLPDEVPYTARLSLERGDVATLLRQRGAESEIMTGVFGLRSSLSGRLVPGRSLFHGADGELRLEARNGAIQRSVPPVLALALASSSLNPFSRREELQYDRAGARFSLQQGLLQTDDLEIDGPDIRLFATGSVDLSQKTPELDAEVVLFLFRQLDRALDWVPILNVLLLGENDNLVAAYFQLVGPWEEPVAQAKPLRTLEEGPGDVLTKGIPRVITRGVKAIGGLFGAGSSEEEPSALPPAEQTDS